MPWGYVAAAGIGLYGAKEGASAAESAAETSAQGQRDALEYQKMVEALPLEIRDKFLPMLADFYGGGEGQQALIEDVKSSPFYEQMIQSGQEGVLAGAGPMGLTRSGNTAIDLSQSNQSVLQRLVSQRLGGIAGLAQQPLNTNAIASSMSGIGQTLGQGQIGAANAMQQGYGGMFQSILAGMNNNWGQPTSPSPPTGWVPDSRAMMSDRRLKKDIKKVGKVGKLNLYDFKYIWSEIIHRGFMADEVKKIVPAAVHRTPSGYYAVDYDLAISGALNYA